MKSPRIEYAVMAGDGVWPWLACAWQDGYLKYIGHFSLERDAKIQAERAAARLASCYPGAKVTERGGCR